MSLTRKEIRQYCLNQVIGITYDVILDFDLTTCYTTESEIEKAKAEQRKPRYVFDRVVNFFATYYRVSQVQETVRNNYDLQDFNDWMTLQNIIGVDMSHRTAKKIINILEKEHNVELNNLPDVDYGKLRKTFDRIFISEKTILETIFDVKLSKQSYHDISRILTDELGISLRKLFTNRMNL